MWWKTHRQQQASRKTVARPAFVMPTPPPLLLLSEQVED